MTDDIKEEVAKWLFKNRYRLPNQRFYANWYDEINASPLTEKEYLNLANEIHSLYKARIKQEVEEAICGRDKRIWELTNSLEKAKAEERERIYNFLIKALRGDYADAKSNQIEYDNNPYWNEKMLKEHHDYWRGQSAAIAKILDAVVSLKEGK